MKWPNWVKTTHLYYSVHTVAKGKLPQSQTRVHSWTTLHNQVVLPRTINKKDCVNTKGWIQWPSSMWKKKRNSKKGKRTALNYIGYINTTVRLCFIKSLSWPACSSFIFGLVEVITYNYNPSQFVHEHTHGVERDHCFILALVVHFSVHSQVPCQVSSLCLCYNLYAWCFNFDDGTIEF